MSDTPETDAHSPWRYAITTPNGVTTHFVPADFARRLERERDEARRLVAVAQEAFNVIHVEVGGWISATIDGGDK